MGNNKKKLPVVIACEILKGVNSDGLVELSYLPPTTRTVGEDRLEQMIVRKLRPMRCSTLGEIIEYGIATERAEAENRTPFTACWRHHSNFSARGTTGRMALNFLAYAVIRAAITDELHRMRANALIIIKLGPE